MAPYDDYLGDDEGYEYVGDEGYDEGGDFLGAPRRAPAPRQRTGGGIRPAQRRPAPRRQADPRMVRRQQFQTARAGSGDPLRDFLMPFPAGTFTAAVTTLALPASPQKPFLGERLVIDFGRVGTTSTGMVQLTSLTVGVDPQFVVNGSVPARAFDPLAVGTRLRLDASDAGVQVGMSLAIAPAPTMTDTVAVSSALIGPALS